MAISFALITEGVSEHRIIKFILQHFFDEEPDITQIQPQIINEKQVSSPGGWNEVIKYCSREEDLRNILEYNDFIIIQIDTDMCEIAPYSVSRMVEGRERTDEELYNAVRERLLSSISETIDYSRVIFAICINMIECWLLPIYETGKKGCATKNCLGRLNTGLRRNSIHVITDKNSNESQNSYDLILGHIKRISEIEECAARQWSFNRFLIDLRSATRGPSLKENIQG